MNSNTLDKRELAIGIFLAAIDSVKPGNLIKRYVSLNNNLLNIGKLSFNLSDIRNIYVVGAGKASALMAQIIESILGDRISGGHIVTKYGHGVELNYINITEAGHPVPDKNGIRATEEILSITDNAGKEDLVLCLISGGGSALLTDVPEGCSLDDLKSVTNTLLRVGADISEMNCIRKHLSRVKGGMLSFSAYPARVVSLILSDVIGDPLDVIASGPTAPDPTTYADALGIIDKYKIRCEIPGKIIEILEQGVKNIRMETLKETDRIFLSTSNMIIGNNKLALEKAREKAEEYGYNPRLVTNKLSGDVTFVADYIMKIIARSKGKGQFNKSCLLFAGEPTVKITGKGLGGRNQHLALQMAEKLKNFKGITFLSAGTDGTDGPTDAAGAVSDSDTSIRAKALGLDVTQYLQNCDSYNFFRKEGGLVITGPTQTNVMDLIIVLM
jgi:glycerate 2-kinase